VRAVHRVSEKIGHYRALARRVTDRMTLDAIARRIKKWKLGKPRCTSGFLTLGNNNGAPVSSLCRRSNSSRSAIQLPRRGRLLRTPNGGQTKGQQRWSVMSNVLFASFADEAMA
jgi:hypothetical protein